MAKLDRNTVHTLGCIFEGTAETVHRMHSELFGSGPFTRSEQTLLDETQQVAQAMARLGIRLLCHVGERPLTGR